jgi:hypothetical protein
MVASSGHGNEYSGCIKGGEFIEYLSGFSRMTVLHGVNLIRPLVACRHCCCSFNKYLLLISGFT